MHIAQRDEGLFEYQSYIRHNQVSAELWIRQHIQHIKHVKTTESGASKKRRLVEVRTMRIVLKFLNPKFAKLQLDYKFNPKFMSDKFPLNEVSPEVIDMSEKVDAENEDRISDIQYLLNEIWFGVKKAVAFVEKNGNLWLADLRGAELINHMSEQSKQQSSYKKKCDKCGETRIYNRFGWCRECGSMLLSVAEQSAKRQRQQQVGVVQHSTMLVLGGRNERAACLIYKFDVF